jgi:hypothetical protein
VPGRNNRKLTCSRVDAVKAHREFPRTFSLPRSDQRRNLAGAWAWDTRALE